jgi:3-oxoacyl-[acyl-carrier-protein] synthase II
MASPNLHQVVITGAGLVTPLGLSRDATWQKVLQGQCGIGPMSAMESALPSGADGGQAPDLPADFEPGLPRESRYLRWAIRDALRDAGVSDQLPYAPDRCGIILGTTLHGMRAGGKFFRSGDPAALKDFLAGAVLGNIRDDLDFTGSALTTCSACSSSLGSIALSVTMLRSGRLDLVIAGGYDAISEYVYAGFNSLRLISPGTLRPFTRGRQGMKVAEGYGIVILERHDDAQRRGAKILAAILGYGESADAHHLTQPHPQGGGAARAIRQAMESAGVAPSDIDLIAAHATGTPDNDASEFAAFSQVFGSSLSGIPAVAFKSHLGHTLGGAGAVELILAAMALRDQIVPACANVTATDVEFEGLNLSTGQAKPAQFRTTLNTSLGFGGANTCVILGRASAPITSPSVSIVSSTCKDALREVFITGIGTVFPGAIGNEAMVRLLSQQSDPVTADTGTIDDADIIALLNARRVRRMSEYVKLSLAATMLCLRDAGLNDIPSFAENCAAILGTTHGSTNYCEQYYGQIVKEGVAAANPMLFAEGVPNAAAAHLSLMLSLKGPCQTVIGSRTAGLDALGIATTRIAAGEWDRAIVGAAEEYSPVVNQAYGRWGLYGAGGFVVGAGAVTFLVESRSSMEARGGRPRGRVLAVAGGTSRGGGVARIVRDVLTKLGTPPIVLGSSNGTWIDRAEEAGVARSGARLASSLYGRLAECFSVLPMAGIAAALLTGLSDPLLTSRRSLGSTATGNFDSPAGHFGSLATDYFGSVSGVALERRDG